MKNYRNIRLFVENNLDCNESFALEVAQSHYLTNVMRCQLGDIVKCFNNKNGEFLAEISSLNKKQTILRPFEKIKNCEKENDVWLLFAPLKKDKTDIVIEKATELGVSKIVPVLTKFVNCEKIKIDRFEAQAKEAAEQCERLSVPEILPSIKLEHLLSNWDENRIMFFMNEKRTGNEALSVFSEYTNKPSAILVGPEGGFADEEIALIEKHKFVKSISLGPRILRAETAAISSLSIWQACAGDWRK